MKKLLDREPQPEMVEAGKVWSNVIGRSSEMIWRAMWDAAPALPEPGEVEQTLRELYPNSRVIMQAADLIAVLQEQCNRLTGMKFSDRMHAALVSRAEKAEAEVNDASQRMALMREAAANWRTEAEGLKAENGELRATLEWVANEMRGRVGSEHYMSRIRETLDAERRKT